MLWIAEYFTYRNWTEKWDEIKKRFGVIYEAFGPAFLVNFRKLILEN